ncbi:glycosyltransferase family 2 protein [Duganella aceris]|uniref:Glycosyltransferase family 2 protein n=1 Tax=Duganella aceris TaxID=2703883 RepID=A0ABX0FEZ2_9BURK|nr:glycosyltransferase family A protein [Duganella aceris]NGZ83105.1 glycosyltransferase family 2 protein [Duganella aceris]
MSAAASAPLVSILLPTHNRPDYAELALRSALAQTYPNLEIVVSDNSDDELTRQRFAPYAERHPQLRYHRIASCPPMENFNNCYSQARGEFVNFLMDDDLYHPEKIARMMQVMLTQDNLGVVTSSRQLIDANGQPMASPPHLAPLFSVDTHVTGLSLGAHMAAGNGNVLGEPTTALFRKAVAGPVFGVYQGHQYSVMSDLATWMTILSSHDCVYLHQPLSYFRVHADQDQRVTRTQIRGHLESMRLICDVWEQGYFIRPEQPPHEQLHASLTTTVSLLARARDILRDPIFNPDQLSATVARATRLLLG